MISSKGMPNPVLPNQTAIPVESFSGIFYIQFIFDLVKIIFIELEPIKSKEQTDTAEHYLRYSVSGLSSAFPNSLSFKIISRQKPLLSFGRA